MSSDSGARSGQARDATDQLAFLAGSPVRRRILRLLRDRRLIERDLRDALDEPRSTVHRNVEELAARGWVEDDADGYRTTWFGAAVLAEFERTVGNVECARELGPFLEHVPVEAVDLDALRDVEVTAPRPNRPLAAVERVRRRLAGASSVRGFTPYLVPSLADGLLERVRDGDCEVEAVLADPAADALLDGDGRPREIRDHVSLYRHDGGVAYALLFVDGGLVLGAFDDDGVPRAVVETDAPAALSWAEATYRRHREAATPVAPGDPGR